MKVLMVGRSKSIAFEELKKYWGDVDFVKPPKVIKLRKYDLVVGQEPTLRVGAYSYLFSRIVGAKLILEVHADYLESELPPIQRKVAKYLLRRSDLVRAVSKKIEEDLKNLGVKNVVLIPSIYVKTDLYRPLKPHSERRPLILSVGRLVEQKNFLLLLHIFKQVKEEIPEAELVILGRGPLEREMLELAKKFKLSDNFKLVTRWLNEEELVTLYNEAAVLVITSKYEGGPRVAFEAGACNTPFVSTRVGILGEIAQEGLHGYFAYNVNDFKVKIIKLLREPNIRQEMGESFRKLIIENFEWNTAVRKYAETYFQIINE